MTNRSVRAKKTEETILETAIDLMEQKGFKAVTTKEIAAASGFSEMTVFRHFGTKENILERAVESYSYLVDMKSLLFDRVEYDLKRDLKKVCEVYHNYKIINYKMILLAYQERNTYPFIGEKLSETPRQLKLYLVEYFQEMNRRGKIRAVDPEVQAMNFLWLQLGYFMSYQIGGKVVAQVALENFVEESIDLFVNSLTPELQKQ